MSRCLPKRLPRGTISFNRYITFLLAMSGATFLTAAAHNKAQEAMIKNCTHLCYFLPPLSPPHHQRHHPGKIPVKLVWLHDMIRGRPVSGSTEHAPMTVLVGPLLKFSVTGLSETGSADGAAGVGREVEGSPSPSSNVRT